jgi:chromate transporter
LAGAAFVAIFFFAFPFPVIIIVAGLIGFFGARAGYSAFTGGIAHGKAKAGPDGESLLGEAIPDHAHPSTAHAIRVAAIWLVLWLAPVIAVAAIAGTDNVFTSIAVFFSKMALVTFGGAYAVLAYVAQQAVSVHHWVTPGEMLDGLGMAETTPGPLIMVLQFVGFMAAFRSPGIFSPLLAGALGACRA